MPDDEAVVKAIKALIAAQLGTLARLTQVLEADEHEGLNTQHVQLGMAPKHNPMMRAGRTSRPSYRLSTAPVAQTVSNVRALDKRVRAAIEGRAVAVGADYCTTPISFETGNEPEQDGDLFIARSTWTFTLTRRSGT